MNSRDPFILSCPQHYAHLSAPAISLSTLALVSEWVNPFLVQNVVQLTVPFLWHFGPFLKCWLQIQALIVVSAREFWPNFICGVGRRKPDTFDASNGFFFPYISFC